MRRLAKDVVPSANVGTEKEDVIWYLLKVTVLTKVAHCEESNDGGDVGRLKELTTKVVTTADRLLFRYLMVPWGISHAK